MASLSFLSVQCSFLCVLYWKQATRTLLRGVSCFIILDDSQLSDIWHKDAGFCELNSKYHEDFTLAYKLFVERAEVLIKELGTKLIPLIQLATTQF